MEKREGGGSGAFAKQALAGDRVPPLFFLPA